MKKDINKGAKIGLNWQKRVFNAKINKDEENDGCWMPF